MDEKIVEAVARGLALKDDLCDEWARKDRIPCVPSGCNCVRLARAAIEAYETALAEAGWQIARPHKWEPEKGWPWDATARVKCERCGAYETDLGVPFSCGSISVEPPAEER